MFENLSDSEIKAMRKYRDSRSTFLFSSDSCVAFYCQALPNIDRIFWVMEGVDILWDCHLSPFHARAWMFGLDEEVSVLLIMSCNIFAWLEFLEWIIWLMSEVCIFYLILQFYGKYYYFFHYYSILLHLFFRASCVMRNIWCALTSRNEKAVKIVCWIADLKCLITYFCVFSLRKWFFKFDFLAMLKLQGYCNFKI